MDGGYVKLWRKSIDSGMMQNPELWVFWCWCLMKATWKPRQVMVDLQTINLNPGEFIFGRRSSGVELNFSEQKIRTFVKKLKTMQNITIKSTNKFSIISIVNWDIYQQDGICANQQINPELTNKQPATNQQITNKQPTTNHKQEVKEVKEVKECKTLKNIITTSCAEVNSAQNQDEKNSPHIPVGLFLSLPMINGEDYFVLDTEVLEKESLFPAVDVRQAFRSMRAWLDANPKNRKTKAGIKKFIAGWLSREQDKYHAPQRNPTNNRSNLVEINGQKISRAAAITYDSLCSVKEELERGTK